MSLEINSMLNNFKELLFHIPMGNVETQTEENVYNQIVFICTYLFSIFIFLGEYC